MQVVLLCFLCGWMVGFGEAGRKCCTRRFHSGVEREGLGAVFGKDEMISIISGWNSATCLTIFYPNVLEQQWEPLALSQDCKMQVVCFWISWCCGNQLSCFPISDSCRLCWSPARSDKWVLCQPQAVWRLLISIWPLYFPFFPKFSQSVRQKHRQSWISLHFILTLLLILKSLSTPCLPLPHLSSSVYKINPHQRPPVGERMEEEDLCQICLSNDQSSRKVQLHPVLLLLFKAVSLVPLDQRTYSVSARAGLGFILGEAGCVNPTQSRVIVT